jgi:hypothetical protein
MAFEADIGRFRRDGWQGDSCLQPIEVPEPLQPRPLVRKG